MTDIAELEERAEEEDTNAMLELAYAYREGDAYEAEYGYGVEKDLKKANEWYARRLVILLKRAEAEDPDAMWQVAYAYREGGFGMEKNEEKANEWWEKRFSILLERAKNDDPDAMDKVAEAYLCGWGVERDRGKSDEWYAKARKARER